MKADWRGGNDTSPSSAHLSPSEVSPLIKKLGFNSEQLPSLIFRSPGREHCSLCLCPQLDSTPWVCKLIKKLGANNFINTMESYSGLMVCLIFNGASLWLKQPPPPPLFFFNTHLSLGAGITPGASTVSFFIFFTRAKRNMGRMCIKLLGWGSDCVFY